MLNKPLHPEVKRERAAVRDAINSFIRAAETNNVKLLFESLQALEYNCWNGWKRLVTKAKTCSVHPDFRFSFLAVWEERGDCHAHNGGPMLIDKSVSLVDHPIVNVGHC
jgi:hypothetical protein